jgi:hypothetical protein
VPFSDHFAAKARVKSLKVTPARPGEFSVVDASAPTQNCTDEIDQTELVQGAASCVDR